MDLKGTKKDISSKEIGLSAQNMLTIISSIFNLIKEGGGRTNMTT